MQCKSEMLTYPQNSFLVRNNLFTDEETDDEIN